MNFRLLKLFLALLLSSNAAFAETEIYQPTPEDAAKVDALATRVMAELAAKCPVKAVNDQTAYATCRDALFSRNSVFRDNLKSFILWGRPPGGDINAVLKEFRATQFGTEVFTGTYAPMWMWDGKYEVDYVAKDKTYRIISSAGFRNELNYGQYPYPFWHEAKKWTDYEDANTMIMWIDPKIMKIAQFTFYKRSERPAVAQVKARHMPTFDGKWMWIDEKGHQQPAPTLFEGLYGSKNPYLAFLDTTYKKFALAMRDADCNSCHVPNNPDKAKRLVLLQTPLHAASEIERVLKDVRQDRMPLDDSGLEKPLKANLKARLLADAEAFAAAVSAARGWETANGKQ